MLWLQLSGVVNAEQLKIAWLAPFEMSHNLKTATSMGGLALSVDTIESDASLLPGDDFE